MNRPTDEQLREIATIAVRASESGRVSLLDNTTALKVGRAAFEASCKIALATVDAPNLDDELDAIVDSWNWNVIESKPLPWARVRQMIRDAFCIGLANRLHSLTAPPRDNASLEVEREIARQTSGDMHGKPWDYNAIVAVVRKADAK